MIAPTVIFFQQYVRYFTFLVAFCFSIGLAAQDTLVQLPVVEISQFAVEPSAAFKIKTIYTDSLQIGANTSIGQAIRSNTGIFIKGYGANGVANITLRGTSAYHTNLSWNGIDISSPTVGQGDFSLFPAAVADAISIRYGLASLIDGTGGFGGSVSLENKLNWANKMSLNATVGIGSFGQHTYSAEVNTGNSTFQSSTRMYYAAAENNFSYTDISQKDYPTEQLSHAKNENYGIIQLLGWKPNVNNFLSAKVWYNKLWRQFPASVFAPEISGEAMNDENTTASFSWTRKKGSNEFLVLAGFSAMKNAYNASASGVDAYTHGFSWQDEFRYRKTLFQEKMVLQAGVEHTTDFVKASGYASNVKQNIFGAYASGDFHITRQFAANVLLREEVTDHKTSPLLGSVAAIFKSGPHAVKGSLARNYRSPSLNELYWYPGGNLQLQPEKSWNFEMGYTIEKSLENAKFKAEVTGYYNFIDNWVIWLPASSFWSPQNIKKVRNSGSELELEYTGRINQITIDVTGSYAFTSSKNVEFYNGNRAALDKQLMYVPMHKLTSTVGFAFKNFSATYGFHLHGKYFISSDNKAYMPKFMLSDLKIAYTIPVAAGGAFSISVSANNLFDYQYQIMPYRPEMGRNYLFSLCYNLKK